jgi:hypothetical protein
MSVRRLERQMLDEHDRRHDDRQPRQRKHTAAPIAARTSPLLSQRRGGPIRHYAKHPHRLSDILDGLLAEILITQHQLVPDLFKHFP